MESDAEAKRLLIEGLITNNQGTPKQTLSNCMFVLTQDNKTKDMFCYNSLTNKIELKTAWWNRTSQDLTDLDEDNIRLYLEVNYNLISEKGVPRAINIIANDNKYHPIKDALNELKWDGTERISELFPKYLGAEKSVYTTEATKLFLLGAISRVFTPGVKFDTMICLVDDEQGGGKSTLLRFLAMNDEWFSDDIKNLDDDNVYRKLQGHWIIEMAEMLATANAKSIESIKSFITRQKDSYKVPYDKHPRDIPRQCVFAGTTNNIDFLPKDKTGNRRFVPIRCHKNKAAEHPLKDEQKTREYCKQCFAEAMEIYRSGKYQLKLPDFMEDQLKEIQEQFKPEDPKVGIIQSWLDKCEADYVCSIMIFKEAFSENEFKEPKPWELREISQIMNREVRGWEKYPTSDSKRRFSNYGKQRAWQRSVPNTLGDKDFEYVDGFGSIGDNPFR